MGYRRGAHLGLLGDALCPWIREWGQVRGWGGASRLKAMLDESQMTVAGANQCRYPTEFDLEKKHFFTLKKSHLKKVS